MNRCGDCKFWGKESESVTREFRSCTGIIHDGYDRNAVGKEDLDDRVDIELVVNIQSRPAVVVDGSGYFAALKTKEDFGCVLFERREA